MTFKAFSEWMTIKHINEEEKCWYIISKSDTETKILCFKNRETAESVCDSFNAALKNSASGLLFEKENENAWSVVENKENKKIINFNDFETTKAVCDAFNKTLQSEKVPELFYIESFSLNLKFN
jgi:hypothetical protein